MIGQSRNSCGNFDNPRKEEAIACMKIRVREDNSDEEKDRVLTGLVNVTTPKPAQPLVRQITNRYGLWKNKTKPAAVWQLMNSKFTCFYALFPIDFRAYQCTYFVK